MGRLGADSVKLLGVVAIVSGASGCSEPQPVSSSYILPGSSYILSISLRPVHPFLAEYERSLHVISGSSGTVEATWDLFADTGGYSGTNLYRLSDQTLLLAGYFQVQQLDLGEMTLETVSLDWVKHGEYLGGWRVTSDGWHFHLASDLPEECLVPIGGDGRPSSPCVLSSPNLEIQPPEGG